MSLKGVREYIVGKVVFCECLVEINRNNNSLLHVTLRNIVELPKLTESEKQETIKVLTLLGHKVQQELIDEKNAGALKWLHENYTENKVKLGAVVLETLANGESRKISTEALNNHYRPIRQDPRKISKVGEIPVELKNKYYGSESSKKIDASDDGFDVFMKQAREMLDKLKKELEEEQKK